MTFDYAIVGGGTAGTVLASRLSARSACKVLLIEAGPDVREDEVPPAISDSFPATAYLDKRFLWNDLRVTTGALSHNDPTRRPPERPYEQARVLGGGSSINGQLANRGSPRDYDEWEARGAGGWNWEAVLPYFRKLERDVDFEGPLHGKDGPVPIRRIFPDQWPEHAKAMGEGFKALGYRYLADQNGDFGDGYFPCAISNLYDRRVSNAVAYLTPTVRQRPNLTILTDTEVQALIFDGRRCAGVRATTGGRLTDYTAQEVVLSCGAVYSPAQLLRAGVGPAAHLRDLGIDVRADRPGVGQGLMDHPSVALASFVKSFARLKRTRRHLLIGLRFSSGIADSPPGDMAVSVSTKTTWHPVGSQISSVTMWVNKTFSEAGRIRLRSPDPRDQPIVDFNLLSDQRDLSRLMAGVRHLSRLFDVPAVNHVAADPFAASFSEKVRAVGAINAKNRLLTWILAQMLDGPASFRRFLIQSMINEGPTLQTLLADDAALEDFVRTAAIGLWHASCSCRMGKDTDPYAVTDSSGRVYGVEGLRVVDASIFPVIPSANTNLTAIMVAEKIADTILMEN